MAPVRAATESITHLVPSGVSGLAVPYLMGSNTVGELLPSVPEGTQLYKVTRSIDRARWTVNQFESGAWARPAETLRPGEGALLRNPGEAFSVTFTGEVPLNVSRAELLPGANLIGLPFAPELDFPPNDGDLLLTWNGASYDQYSYFEGFGWLGMGNLGLPPIHRAQGLMYLRRDPGGAGPWPEPAPALFFYNHIPASAFDVPLMTTLECVGTNLVAQLWLVNSNSGLGVPVRIDPDGYFDLSADLVRESSW